MNLVLSFYQALVITLLASLNFALILKRTFVNEKAISYVSMGHKEMTFFSKDDMNSNENTVTIYDFERSRILSITERVTLRSNIIRSPKDTSHKNDNSDNIYAEECLGCNIYTSNFSQVVHTFY